MEGNDLTTTAAGTAYDVLLGVHRQSTVATWYDLDVRRQNTVAVGDADDVDGAGDAEDGESAVDGCRSGAWVFRRHCRYSDNANAPEEVAASVRHRHQAVQHGDNALARTETLTAVTGRLEYIGHLGLAALARYDVSGVVPAVAAALDNRKDGNHNVDCGSNQVEDPGTVPDDDHRPCVDLPPSSPSATVRT